MRKGVVGDLSPVAASATTVAAATTAVAAATTAKTVSTATTETVSPTTATGEAVPTTAAVEATGTATAITAGSPAAVSRCRNSRRGLVRRPRLIARSGLEIPHRALGSGVSKALVTLPAEAAARLPLECAPVGSIRLALPAITVPELAAGLSLEGTPVAAERLAKRIASANAGRAHPRSCLEAPRQLPVRIGHPQPVSGVVGPDTPASKSAAVASKSVIPEKRVIDEYVTTEPVRPPAPSAPSAPSAETPSTKV